MTTTGNQESTIVNRKSKIKMRRRRRRIALVLFAVAIVAFITYQALTVPAGPKDENWPKTLKELDAWYPHVAPEENAALLYERAFASANFSQSLGDLPFVGGGKLPSTKEPLSGDMKATMTQFLDNNTTTLELMHEAAKYRKSRYSVDLILGLKFELPHLKRLRAIANILNMQAAILAEDDAPESAADAIVASLAVGRSLRSEPIVMSQLLRQAIDADAISAVERILNRTHLSPQSMSRISQALADAENPEAITRGLVGDRCIWHTDRFSWNIDKAYAWSGCGQQNPFNQLIAASRCPFPEALARANELKLDNSNPIRAIASSPVKALVDTIPAQARLAASVRVAQTVLAIEQYRIASGKLPDSLVDLVPNFLAEVPVDPFDGAKLRYNIMSNGYTVYSVGANQKDDEGVPSKDHNWHEGDITFTVERP